jgi:hypothetical protein
MLTDSKASVDLLRIMQREGAPPTHTPCSAAPLPTPCSAAPCAHSPPHPSAARGRWGSYAAGQSQGPRG